MNTCVLCGREFSPRCNCPPVDLDRYDGPDGDYQPETCAGCQLCKSCEATGLAAGKMLADAKRYPDPERVR